MKKNLAYTFADTPEYLVYALVLFQSYRDNVNETDKLKLYVPSFNKDILEFLTRFEVQLSKLNVEIGFCNPVISKEAFSNKFYKKVSVYPNDFVKLMGILETEYQYAAFFDSDMLIVNDISEAYSGYFNYTDGPASPLNSGFFSTRTSTHDALHLFEWVSSERYSDKEGWNGHYLKEDHRCRETTQGQLYAYYVLEDNDFDIRMLAQKKFNCQFANDFDAQTSVLHFTAAGKPLRYLYKNTPNPEWSEYKLWHSEWKKYADKLGIFEDDYAYRAFRHSLKSVDLAKHILRRKAKELFRSRRYA